MSTPRPRIALHAVGCKLNQAELQQLALAFESQGFPVVGPRDDADAYVINTCTVTAEADRKVRQWLRMVRRTHPESLLVACGCGVERGALQLEPLADLLLGNDEKHRLVEMVSARLAPSTSRYGDRGPERHVGRTRSLVKVQEGCVTPCAYCIVPYVRRGERSVPADEVLGTLRDRITAGYQELVLTGTRIGAYRDGDIDLAGLLRRTLELPGLGRVRVSSLQPQELRDDLLSLWADRRLCPHFHLSLQSGSGSVLRRMRRRYDPDSYAVALARIREAVPGAAITTDVIVGFPGETDAEFEQSLAFADACAFARIHVFPFSRRPGTPAASMPDQVSGPVVKQRVAAMEQLGERSRLAYAASWLGRPLQVLWEEETESGSGVYAGTSENYLRLLCHSAAPLQNTLEDVTVSHIDAAGLWAGRGA